MINRSTRSKSATAPRQGAEGTGCSRRDTLAARLTPDRRLGGLRLVPTPELVGRVIADVPRGSVITVSELTERLKQRFGGDRVGPRALNSSLQRLEECTVESLGREHEPKVPLWRLVRNDGSVDPNSAIKPLYSAARLREEGLCVSWDRGCWKVLDRTAH